MHWDSSPQFSRTVSSVISSRCGAEGGEALVCHPPCSRPIWRDAARAEGGSEGTRAPGPRCCGWGKQVTAYAHLEALQVNKAMAAWKVRHTHPGLAQEFRVRDAQHPLLDPSLQACTQTNCLPVDFYTGTVEKRWTWVQGIGAQWEGRRANGHRFHAVAITAVFILYICSLGFVFFLFSWWKADEHCKDLYIPLYTAACSYQGEVMLCYNKYSGTQGNGPWRKKTVVW